MTLIDPVRIMPRAALALKELQTSETWKAALEGASLAPSPLLVLSIAPAVEPRKARPARLPDYYIVSIAREKGTTGRFAHRSPRRWS